MNVKKKLLIALLSATCVTAGAFGLTACNNESGEPVDPDAALKAAYEVYRQEAGESAFSYNQWLLVIKTGGLNNNPPVEQVDELKEAYDAYKATAGENALTYEQWLAIIKSQGVNNDAPIDPETALKAAYEVYKAAAGENAVAYDAWLAVIKSEGVNNNEPIDPATELKAAYEVYKAAAGENALTYEAWLEIIKSQGVNNDAPIDPATELKATYEVYKAAAGENALAYKAWLAIIVSGNVNNSPNANVDELFEVYKEYVDIAGESALTFEAWLAVIKSEGVNNDAPIDPATELKAAYDQYMTVAGENALEYSQWLAIIKSEGINTANVNELAEAYKEYVKAAGDDALAYNEWVTLITSGLKSPLEAAYEEYIAATAAAGGLALDFEDWQSMIKTYNEPIANKTIVSSYVDNHGNFILKFTDDKEVIVGKVTEDFTVLIGDKEVTVTAPSLYTVRAVDQFGDGAKDVYLSFGYINHVVKEVEDGEGHGTGETFVDNVFVEIDFGKTDSYGYLYFSLVPEEGKTYIVRLADPSTADFVEKYGNVDSLPANYELDNIPITGKAFNDSKQMDFTLMNRVNAFPYSATPYYEYSRTHNEEDPSNPIVVNNPLELTLKKNVYSYFAFSSYVNPETVNETDINPDTGKKYTYAEAQAEGNRRINNAKAAAAGLYKISIVSNSENASLFYFAGGTGYTATDPETGVPTNILKIAGKLPEGYDKSLHTGTNNITLNLNDEYSAGTYYFWVSSTEACNVTVTIERLGDANASPEVVTTEYEVTGNPAAYTEQSGKLTLVPVDGSVEIVFNETDGYYHIGSKDGAVLHVNLNKPIGRVNSDGVGVAGTPNVSPKGTNVFVFNYDWIKPDWTEQALPTKAYDFNNLVNTYSALCNSDGVYPVNQDLYTFLQFFGDLCITASAGSNTNWLIPCQYYAV